MGGTLRRADGQALIMVAVVLPVLLALAGLVVDGSSLFVDRRAAQNAADAAALAAADELGPANDPACSADPACLATLKSKAASMAQAYVAKNGLDASAFHECRTATDNDCYVYPFQGDNSRVEVRVHKPGTGVFARAAGVNVFDTSAHAAAIAKPTVQINPGRPIAIFAYAHNGTDPCGDPDGITIDGNSANIDAVLSNGTVTLNGNTQVEVGWLGYGPPPQNCPSAGSNQANGSTWARQPSTIDWPRTFDRTAVCAGHTSTSQVNLDNPADGIYCSSVGIQLTGLGAGKTYHLTLVAPVVSIPSNNNHFTIAPYNAGLDTANKDLCIWQYPSGPSQDFAFDHNNSSIQGVVWIQNGNMSYTGNLGVTGFYEAQNVAVTGNSYTMTGSGPPEGGSTTITGATASLDE